MGQVFHGSAKITHAIRAELQRLEEGAIIALRVQASLSIDELRAMFVTG